VPTPETPSVAQWLDHPAREGAEAIVPLLAQAGLIADPGRAAAKPAAKTLLAAGAGAPPSYASLRGPGRATVLAHDAAVSRLRRARDPQRPDYAELLAAYIASPMTGMTTIIDMARQKAGYNPLGTDDSGRSDFIVELIYCPLFATSHDSASFDIDPNKSGSDIASAVRRFVGNDPVTAPVLRKQLDDTVQAAFSNPGAAQSVELLNEYTLDTSGGYRFTLARSSCQIAIAILPPMNVLVAGRGVRGSMTFTFKAQDWPQWAEKILQKHLKNVDEWLEETGNLR
jgi:hypothetical protein